MKKVPLHLQAIPNKQTIWVTVCIYHANGAVTKVPLCTPRTRLLPRSSHVECHLFLGRNINNLKYADDTTLKAESEEELKSHLMRVKEKSEKASLKFSIQNIKIMASGPITSWQIDGGKTKNSGGFYFLGLQNHYGQLLQPWN